MLLSLNIHIGLVYYFGSRLTFPLNLLAISVNDLRFIETPNASNERDK